MQQDEAGQIGLPVSTSSSSGCALYSESPLDPSLRQIRLLHLHPGAWADSIKCSLHVVSLDNAPQFKAISYVWGDPAETVPIAVNGQSFGVTHSLFTGLQRMRDCSETVTLWADAVCINQADNSEKGHQVRLMGDIYSSAAEVLVWLGYGTSLHDVPEQEPTIYSFAGQEHDDKLVDTYVQQHLSENLDRSQRTFGPGEDSHGAFVFLKSLASGKHFHELPFFDFEGERLLSVRRPWPQILRALNTLGTVPWWNRVWTLQEIVLARKATVLYSNINAPWELLDEALHSKSDHTYCCADHLIALAGSAYGMDVDFEDIMNELGVKIEDEIGVLRTSHSTKRQEVLSALMTKTDYRDTTDVRDKIFALLGLLPSRYKKSNLLPDYSLSAREVFIKASYIELRRDAYAHRSGYQELMGTHRTDVPGLPSWVTKKSSSKYWQAYQEDRIADADLFSAAGRTPAGLSREGDVLIVDVLPEIDYVAYVGPTMFDDYSSLTKGSSGDGFVNVMKIWRQMCGLDYRKDSIYTGKQTWQEAFWRTVANDCIDMQQYDGLGAPDAGGRRLRDSEISDLPEDWWSWLQSEFPGKDVKNSLTVPKGGDSDSSLRTKKDMIRLFDHAVQVATAVRKFFITTNGRMGLGPAAVFPGDEIVLLCGGSVPFSIRESESDPVAKLIGDVYVHGLMDGEGVPRDWKGKVVSTHLR